MEARRGLAALVLAATAAGCAGTSDGPLEQEGPPPPLSALPEGELAALRLDVLEAALRHMLAEVEGGEYSFLLVEGDDPSPEILARLSGRTPPVLPGSLAHTPAHDGPTHVESGRPGILFEVESILLRSAREAEVRGSYWVMFLLAKGSAYTLERQPKGDWKVVAERMTWIS